MKKLFTIIFLFLYSVKYSQNKELIIIDSISNKPIPFVTIQYLNKNLGTYGNENGIFNINPKEIDSLKLTHISYSEKTVSIKELNDTIFLIPVSIVLKEVLLDNGKKIVKVIDFPRKNGSFGSFPMTSKSEIVTFLIPDKTIQNKEIKEITFKFEKKYNNEFENNIETATRINIYDSKNKKINKKIYESEVFKINPFKNEKLNIVLSDNITFDINGIFIGIEIIGDVDINGNFTNKQSILRPVLTENNSKYYKAVTFLRFSYFENQRLISLNEIYKEHVSDKIKRNLSISFIVYE